MSEFVSIRRNQITEERIKILQQELGFVRGAKCLFQKEFYRLWDLEVFDAAIHACLWPIAVADQRCNSKMPVMMPKAISVPIEHVETTGSLINKLEASSLDQGLRDAVILFLKGE